MLEAGDTGGLREPIWCWRQPCFLPPPGSWADRGVSSGLFPDKQTLPFSLSLGSGYSAPAGGSIGWQRCWQGSMVHMFDSNNSRLVGVTSSPSHHWLTLMHQHCHAL